MIINPSSNRSEPVIPITGTPNIRTQLWIDPTVEDQNSSYYTAADTLTNSTKELYGLDANAVPDDVFGELSRFNSGLGNEYVWAKNIGKDVWTETPSTEVTNQFAVGQRAYIADSVRNKNGNFELINPVLVTFTHDVNPTLVLRGKYAFPENPMVTVWSKATYFTENASPYWNNAFVSCSKGTVVYCTNIKTVEEPVGYVNSPDPNAYPPAVSDGYTYTALGQLGEKARIATGSYTGTDASTVTLHFDFIPKMLIVIGKSDKSGYASQFAFFVNSATTGIALSTSSFNASGDIPDVSWGNTISWTSTSTQQQLNHGYYTYNYIAIG